jgi:hypothetical protein
MTRLQQPSVFAALITEHTGASAPDNARMLLEEEPSPPIMPTPATSAAYQGPELVQDDSDMSRALSTWVSDSSEILLQSLAYSDAIMPGEGHHATSSSTQVVEDR